METRTSFWERPFQSILAARVGFKKPLCKFSKPFFRLNHCTIDGTINAVLSFEKYAIYIFRLKSQNWTDKFIFKLQVDTTAHLRNTPNVILEGSQ